MRIGIVGSGIAGLAAGWFLKQAGHQITVFEKHATLGMDAHSVDVKVAGESVRTDVPPRMFNEAQWPSLCDLYRQIGVEIELVSPTKSFSRLGKPAVLQLGASFQPKLSPTLVLNPVSRAITKDIGRMMVAAPKYLRNPNGQTMGEYLDSENYSVSFITEFLYPALSSTVCTCSYASLNQYPAATLLQMMQDLIAPEGLFRTSRGTRDVVTRLAKDLDDIHLNASVKRVTQSGGITQVKIVEGDEFEFDHVVVATQANVVEALVDGLSAEEVTALGLIKYENVRTVVHRDPALMPARRKDWANFNLINDGEGQAAMCSIWLNEFYPNSKFESDIFQTIMPLMEPARDLLIATANMQRPVVNRRTLEVQKMIVELHQEPNRRIWFCGSYASPGVPLLESGVRSSLSVCKRILSREFNLT